MRPGCLAGVADVVSGIGLEQPPMIATLLQRQVVSKAANARKLREHGSRDGSCLDSNIWPKVGRKARREGTGAVRRYPGGSEYANIFETLSRLIPKSRAILRPLAHGSVRNSVSFL